MKKNIQLEKGWENVLQDEFENNYMQHLKRWMQWELILLIRV